VLRDLKYAVRSLRHSPAFHAIVVLTLAVAVAANAIVFAGVKRIVLAPLPFGNADRLVTVAEISASAPRGDGISIAAARELRDRSPSLERLSVYADYGVRPIVGGRAVELRGMRVSADFFDTLAIPMYLGRGFSGEEDRAGGDRVLILSFGAWRELFGADPSIVGQTVPAVDGTYVVIGVLPSAFHPLHMSNPAEFPQVFVPLGARAQLRCWSNSCRGWRAVGRLAPGVGRADAQGAIAAAYASLTHDHGNDYPATASVRILPLKDDVVGQFDKALILLQAAVLLLLVLACANAATLLLARAIRRQSEMLLRTALGAGRWQLIRQMLVESATLAVLAAGLGAGIAWVAVRFIARSGTTNIPRIGELAPDMSMLLFAGAAATVASLAAGILPARVTFRNVTSLQVGARAAGQPGLRSLVSLLVGAEIALAFVLVLSMALLSRSYWQLLRVDPGFNPQDVLTVSLLPGGGRYPTQMRRLAYFDAVVERMRHIPEVTAAGHASTLPFSHPSTTQVYVRDRPAAKGADAPSLDVYLVSADYLSVMQIPLRRGRTLSAADRLSTARVALVSDSAAQRLFGDADPIGQHIRLDSDQAGSWATVVGMVGNVHQYALDRRADPAVYLPAAQEIPGQAWASLVVRTSVPTAGIESIARQAMVEVDPFQPVFHMQPMQTYIDLSMAERSLTLSLLAVFAVLGLTVATGGVYGIVSYAVEQRTHEMGVRLALGATPSMLRRMIVREMLSIVAIGIVAGAIASLFFTRFLSAFLFGISRLDGPTLFVVALVLMTTAWAASYAPVVRITRIESARALRAD
jgi:putative ABC transport system permease protein